MTPRTSYSHENSGPVRIMLQLTFAEASDLAKVFGEMDYKRSLILMQLAKPNSKYDVLTFMESLPKTARVSRASLYRIVDELEENGFVTSAEPRPMKNRPEETLKLYQLSLKGRLATWIFSYTLILDPKTPRSLMDQLDPAELVKIFESTRGAKLFVEFLRWNRKRGNDLSRVHLDLFDLVSGFLPVILHHPEAISDEELSLSLSESKDFGFDAPNLNPILVRKLIEAWRKAMTGLEKEFLGRKK
jgi:DNA-binding PadR family transcriptional regulator